MGGSISFEIRSCMVMYDRTDKITKVILGILTALMCGLIFYYTYLAILLYIKGGNLGLQIALHSAADFIVKTWGLPIYILVLAIVYPSYMSIFDVKNDDKFVIDEDEHEIVTTCYEETASGHTLPTEFVESHIPFDSISKIKVYKFRRCVHIYGTGKMIINKKGKYITKDCTMKCKIRGVEAMEGLLDILGFLKDKLVFRPL